MKWVLIKNYSTEPVPLLKKENNFSLMVFFFGSLTTSGLKFSFIKTCSVPEISIENLLCERSIFLKLVCI